MISTDRIEAYLLHQQEGQRAHRWMFQAFRRVRHFALGRVAISWSGLSLAGQFIVATAAVMVCAMTIYGLWLDERIRAGVVHSAANGAALYINGVVEQHLQDLKQQVVQTRQLALRAQMNPHFIFNCLNSINGFILKNDSITASTYLIKFSKLIRLILEHSNEKSISLQSELDALKLYIEMESLRFEKKFSYSIEVDDSISVDSVQVPPLLLQPFVENSIWHGLLHKDSEGQLRVRITQNDSLLECVIEDNGVGRQQSGEQKSKISTHKKSLGIKLTKERLALLNGYGNAESFLKVIDLENADGTSAGTKVIISIPLNQD